MHVRAPPHHHHATTYVAADILYHTCSAAATKLLDSNDISFSQSLSPLQNSGHCNSFHCLGHSENVYDDDDTHTHTHTHTVANFIFF